MTQDSPAAEDQPARGTRRKRRKGDGEQFTAVLGEGRTITVVGPHLTMDSLIASLEELLGRAKRGKAQSLQLRTFVQVLFDQNGHRSAGGSAI